MTEIFIVRAFGGRWEDAWENSLRACSTRGGAEDLIKNYEKWIDKIRALELPESLQEYNWDVEDDRQELYGEAIQEFKLQVMIDMGIPEIDRDFVLANWDSSYDCDRPNYTIDTLVLQ